MGRRLAFSSNNQHPWIIGGDFNVIRDVYQCIGVSLSLIPIS